MYLTRPADDTKEVCRILRPWSDNVDASGKVIPGIQLVNDVGEIVTLSLK